MLADTVAYAGIFILAMCLAGQAGLGRASAAFALLVHAKHAYNFLAAAVQERQAKDEATIIGLQRILSALEAEVLPTSARNRALMEENKEYKASSLSMQASLHALSEELSKAREMMDQHEATITHLKEAHAKDEVTTDAELWQQLSTFEAQNCVLVEENKKYKTSSLSLKESIRTLSKDLLNARETVAQHDETITGLKEGKLVLESAVGYRDKRLAFLSKTCEDVASSVIVLQQKLEQKTKEAADWKDLYMHPDLNAVRPHQARHREASGSNTSDLSPTGMIAAKNQEIAQLKDRISECHAQLAMCRCGNLLAKARLEAKATRRLVHSKSQSRRRRAVKSGPRFPRKSQWDSDEDEK
ncbi:hypothetical protein H1R20_g6606, partial [Candolleomyces eurysporus]